MQERFQKSELIRVSAYLTPDEHRRFKAWCIPQDRGPEAALARLIRKTIQGGASDADAKVELPAGTRLNLNGVKSAPGFEDEPEEKSAGGPSNHGFVPRKAIPGSELSTDAEAVMKYETFLAAGEWIPDALAKVDAIWRKNGLAYDWQTVELPLYIRDEYRERAVAAGRDAEADLEIHDRALERI